MLAKVRQNKIKEILFNQKSVTVIELAEKLKVSEETIRRDFNVLEIEGILKRTHGGAMLENRMTSNAQNKILSNVLVDEKRIIAQQAIALLQKNDSIFLDSSTTALHIAKMLPNKPLTVTTNSLSILSKLENKDQIRLLSTGGTFSQRKKCFVGTSAITMLREYYFDKAFVSARSLDIIHGITVSDDNEVLLKRIVSEHTSSLILIADATKLNKVSFAQLFSFDQIDQFITDQPVSRAWQTLFEEYKIVCHDTRLS